MKNSTKILSVLLSLIMALSVFTVVPFTVSAAEVDCTTSGDGESGTTGDCTWRIEGSTLYISGDGEMGSYYVFGDYTTPWSHYGITEVVIEEGVTNIGSGAFYSCKELESVTIPPTVLVIGRGAFYGCNNLMRVYISDISVWCSIRFSYGDDLSNESRNYLATAHELYLNGELVTDLTIPESVTRIGDYQFYGCLSLTSVTIPDSVTSIGNRAFYSCTGLTSVVIPGSVTDIGDYAFYECSGLLNVTIPPSVTSVGRCALGYYYNGSYVDKISGFTIYSCYASAAQEYAINYDFNFVVVGDSPTGDCFWRVEGTKLIISGSGKMDNYSYSRAPWSDSEIVKWSGSEITEAVIENGVTNIGKYAFNGCHELETASIGNGVKSIGRWAFYNCEKLKSIILPNSVNIIGEEAFSGCTDLESVTMSGSVTDIGSHAFYNCSSLTSVTVPDSVTNIDDKALGWYWDEEYGLSRKVNNFTIKGYEGSMAETYARNNGLRFVSLLAKTGDADGDGEITVMDATEVQYLLAGLKPHVDESLIMFADVDQNGLLEIIDVTYILRHVAGEEVPYTIG